MFLSFYFYKNFYKNFCIFLIILSLVFVSGDLFVRLSMLPTFTSAAWVFFYMLPLMLSMALPIASCIAIQLSIGNLYTTDEVLFFHYFSSARKTIYKTVFVFSLTLLFLYIPFIFHLVPHSYKKGKDFIVNFAKEQFYQLEEKKLHNILPNLTLYFKKKDLSERDKPKFYNLLLTFNEKNKDRYLINSKGGYFHKNILYLKDGMIQNMGKDKFYTAYFEETEINLKRFFFDEQESKDTHLKFFTLGQLLKNKHLQKQVFFEFHKRIAQTLWQFLLPFLSLFLILLFARNKSNLLISVLLSGFLFLSFYFSVNLGFCVFGSPALALIFLYTLPVAMFFILMFAYKWKYNL
ncbi:MAG: LptF/LptG family permease [bacterium]